MYLSRLEKMVNLPQSLPKARKVKGKDRHVFFSDEPLWDKVFPLVAPL